MEFLSTTRAAKTFISRKSFNVKKKKWKARTTWNVTGANDCTFYLTDGAERDHQQHAGDEVRNGGAGGRRRTRPTALRQCQAIQQDTQEEAGSSETRSSWKNPEGEKGED